MMARISTAVDQLPWYKVVAFNVVILGLTIALSFSLLEYGLARYYRSTESEVTWTVFDTTLGWRPTPGTYRVKPLHSLITHEVTINENGLRNREIKGRGEGVKRLVILGDSIPFAASTATENVFPVLLENILNNHDRFEVINAGVPGYGTAQELLMMRDLVAKNITGNLYILMVTTNDILDNMRLGNYNAPAALAQPEFELGPNDELKLRHLPEKSTLNAEPPRHARFYTVEVVRNSISTFLQTRPQLVGFLGRFGLKPSLPRMPSLIDGWYDDRTLKPGVPLLKALIREIRDEARNNHASLLVSLVPSPFQVYRDVYDPMLTRTFANNTAVADYMADPIKPQKVLSGMCDELKIPCLDLLPILVHENGKELFNPSDGHFSNEGHALVAQQLARFVTESVESDRSSQH